MAFLITCPHCGPRLGYEFRYGGEDKGPRPAQQDLSPEDWVDYVHLNRCVAGPTREWWFHGDGCSAWFTIWRDTRTNLEVPPPVGPGSEPDRNLRSEAYPAEPDPTCEEDPS